MDMNFANTRMVVDGVDRVFVMGQLVMDKIVRRGGEEKYHHHPSPDDLM